MQLRGNLARGTVRQSEEDNIMISEHLRRRFRHKPIAERNQLWMVLSQQCSSAGAPRDCPHFHLGMTEQQPKQLPACITCSTRHCDTYRHSHDYAIANKVMQNMSHYLELQSCSVLHEGSK
jgi:hypothetical protein